MKLLIVGVVTYLLLRNYIAVSATADAITFQYVGPSVRKVIAQ